VHWITEQDHRRTLSRSEGYGSTLFLKPISPVSTAETEHHGESIEVADPAFAANDRGVRREQMILINHLLLRGPHTHLSDRNSSTKVSGLQISDRDHLPFCLLRKLNSVKNASHCAEFLLKIIGESNKTTCLQIETRKQNHK